MSSFLKNFFKVSFFTILSRVTGFIRTIFFAYYFGASALFDAFVIAFKLPNLFRRLFSEGAINSAIIPILSGLDKNKGKKSKKIIIFRHIFTFYLIALSLLIILVILLAPYITQLFYLLKTHSSSPLKETTLFLQIMFPYLLFVSLAALCQSVLNTHHIFSISAAMPVVFNLMIIAVCLFFPFLNLTLFEKMILISISTLFGGLFQFILQVPSVLRLGYSFKTDLFFLKNPHFKKFILLMAPILFSSGIYQINVILIDPIAISLGEGAVSILHYSNRLLELPLGIIGVSLGTVGLPLLSKYGTKKNFKKVSEILLNILLFLITIIMPIFTLTLLYREKIISLLLEGGTFGFKEIQLTANCLFFHMLAFPFIAINRIFMIAFFSLKNTKFPLKIAFVSIFVNLASCLLLTKILDFFVEGIAIASFLTGLVSSLLLLIGIKKEIKYFRLKALFKKIYQTTLACFLTLSFILLISKINLYHYFSKMLTEFPLVKQSFIKKISLFTELSFNSILFISTYILILFLLRDQEIKMFFKKFNKKNS